MNCWIQDLHSPTAAELLELSSGMATIRKALSKFSLENKSLAAKFTILEDAYNELNNKLHAETAQRVMLEAAVAELRSKVNAMELAEDVIFAKSIVGAAQARLIEKICEDSGETYSCVSDVLYDVQNKCASKKITENWGNCCAAWDERLLPRLIRDLTYSRGAVCHAEDRDPAKFASLTAKSVREAMGSVVLQNGKPVEKSQIKALLKLHCFTSAKVSTPESETDEN